MGLRSASMPYDWNVTYWKAIEDTIVSHFDNYMVKEKLYQYKDYPHCYENCSAGVTFVHDFVDYSPLDKQFDKVKEKYDRRISAFYNSIIEPTVFIRYCMNAEEVYCIEKRYQNIKVIFTGFNEQNEIFFLTHDDIDISKVPSIENIFIIQKGDNESESKTPIIDCEVLYTLLNNAKFEKRNENLEFYYRKHDNTSIEYRIRKRIRKIKKHIHKHKKYAHEKQI